MSASILPGMELVEPGRPTICADVPPRWRVRYAWLWGRRRHVGRIVPAEQYPYRYAWGNNAARAELKGRRCRIICSGRLGSALLEFEDGRRVITSRRALRRAG